MFKKMIILAGIGISFLVPSVFANSESMAFKACQEYSSMLKQKNPKSVTLPCNLNIHSATQWQCMYQYQIKENWTYSESATKCFRKAPALASFMENDNQYSEIEPKIICEQAIKDFEANHPENKQINFLYNLCKVTDKTAAMWACMDTFAKNKNSFNYSAGQCFSE